jgi:aspartate ammonia-lyase
MKGENMTQTVQPSTSSLTHAKSFREEADSIGIKQIPSNALYGVQSLRAKENFPMTHESMRPEMINALAYVKKACAIANENSGILEKRKAEAIADACNEIIAGKYHDAFIVDPIQGGAGTSMNMNANEVIANLAAAYSGRRIGQYDWIHPNDDVNMGQSTNDVIPTAGKLACLWLLNTYEKSLQELILSCQKKADEFSDVLKMGRTQLQDAVPIRLGQEFDAYASSLQRSLDRIRMISQEMHQINLGGSAIGTCVNVDRSYYFMICSELSKETGIAFEHCSDLVDGTQNIDCFASVSSAIKESAIALSKMANDLRLLSSGPKTGIGEIALPAKQNGSSIMPGKINPVIPEVVSQAAYKVMGNDVTISLACEAGQLELNAFEPVVFYSLFQSIDLMSNAVDTFRINCIEGIQADTERCSRLLNASVGIATALNPIIGYAKAASLAKEALKKGRSVGELAVEKGYLKQEELDEVLDPYQMTKLAQYSHKEN